MPTAPAKTLAAPAAVAAVAIAGAAVLRFRDPHTATYVLCPFHELTGWWCPLCGGLRAVNDLVHGQILTSLSSNFLVLSLCGAWLVWAVAALSGRRIGIAPGRGTGIAIIALLVGFTIFRNTPAGAWLAPAA